MFGSCITGQVWLLWRQFGDMNLPKDIDILLFTVKRRCADIFSLGDKVDSLLLRTSTVEFVYFVSLQGNTWAVL